MKEATGELNMTVITVVAIAAVGLIFTLFVWPSIQANMMMSTACSQVDMNGSFHRTDNGNGGGDEGEINCDNFVCTATYQNREYVKECN